MSAKNKFSRWLLLALVLGLTGLAVWLGWRWLFAGLPSLEALSQGLNAPSVRIVDRNRRLLYEALPEQGGRHSVIALEAIPLALRQATIATEDHNFYSNPGVDAGGILRAAWINLRGGETLAGGSTITQQVARTLLMDPEERAERSLRRKLREAMLAWRLTLAYSKDEILALYLNQTYYGGMAYGVEAAAQTFFGKPAAELDLAESALLAGLPQAPALYNPYTDLQAARRRQAVVLRLMEEQGYIDADQRRLAEQEPLGLASAPYPIEAPHFVMMVRAALDRFFTPEEIRAQGGLVVRTSLDLDWQRHAEDAVRTQLAQLARQDEGLGHNVNNAALVALDPRSGEILALVGSPDFFDEQNGGAINMALSPRQPGSALKPLVYAAAMNPQATGGPWTAATMLEDVRTPFTTGDGQAYIPQNYDRREHGPVLLRQALASSLNIPAVKALEHIGLQALFDLASRMGIRTLQDPASYDLSLALGGGQVRLLELTAAYGAFANGGYRLEPQFILDVSNPQGELLYQAPPVSKMQVLDERVAWLISDILSDKDARRLGFGEHSILALDRPAAVKTGTTSNFHDNWTVGYTPALVVGVWSGNTSYEPMREVNGLSGAAPVWHQFMRTVLADQPEQPFLQPPGLAQVEICQLSGLLPSEACPYRRLEWFIEGTEPQAQDSFYRFVTLDQASGGLAKPDTPAERRQRQVVLDLPAELQPWARQQGLALYSDLAGRASESAAGEAELLPQSSALRLLSPAQGSVYWLSVSLDQQSQRIRLEAQAPAGVRQLSFWIDGLQVAVLQDEPYQAWWTLEKGMHQAWVQAILASGETLTSEAAAFEVK